MIKGESSIDKAVGIFNDGLRFCLTEFFQR